MDNATSVVIQPIPLLNLNKIAFLHQTVIHKNRDVFIEGSPETLCLFYGKVNITDNPDPAKAKYSIKGLQILNQTFNATVVDKTKQHTFNGHLVNYLYEGKGTLIDDQNKKEYRGYFSKGEMLGLFDVVDLTGKKETKCQFIDEKGNKK